MNETFGHGVPARPSEAARKVYRIAERWLYIGYALLDEPGGRPVWSIPEGERVGIENLSPHDLRRASITACLLAGVPPELIAKYHGHEDLPTTFEHYVFGLSAVQARDIRSFLSREENQVWVAITDAVQLLDITKMAVYKRYSPQNSKVRVIDSPNASGFVLERSGGPRYVNAIDLAAHVRLRQRRVANSKR